MDSNGLHTLVFGHTGLNQQTEVKLRSKKTGQTNIVVRKVHTLHIEVVKITRNIHNKADNSDWIILVHS